MSTKEDSGLVDRRSLREVEEGSVAGAFAGGKAPLSSDAQMANTKRAREMRKRQEKVIRRSPNRVGKLSK